MNRRNDIELEIDLEEAGKRIDVYLSGLLESFSRSRIQNLISTGNIRVNDDLVKNSYKLRYEDKINIGLPEDRPLEVNAENIELDIVYEDKDLLVVNKPDDMLTHPAPGKYSGTLVNALLYHCKDSLSGINGILRPGIVHRLDKDTTGLILVAKNDFSHQHLARQFQERSIDKYYVAIIQGNLKDNEGIIDAPIDRHPVKRERMAIVESGKPATTRWQVLERFSVATFIEAKLLTGRTHQLRVHFAHLKHPILGDPVYGQPKKQKIKLNRQALQAYKLSFIHPATGKPLCFKIDFDDEIKRVLKIFNSDYLKT